jgi:predicted acetyltransferase
MLRIVDAPAAIAARGYPSQVSLSLPLELTDPVLPANSGAWQLEVLGGAGILKRTGKPATSALRLGARGLAALFAGVGVGSLRLAGLVAAGDPGADDALDCAFGGAAFLIDHW